MGNESQTIEDLKEQFSQSLRILTEIVRCFDADLWLNGGTGYQTPARLAFHALLGVGYYTEYRSGLAEQVGDDWQGLPTSQLPNQTDIQSLIEETEPRLLSWLDELDLDGANTSFPWAGKTNTGLVSFLLRHTIYHTGELNAILYQSRGGDLEDLWMKGFDA